MDFLYLRYKRDKGHGIRIEFEKSYYGTWNAIPVEDAIKTLKSWIKELEKEFKEFDKK